MRRDIRLFIFLVKLFTFQYVYVHVPAAGRISHHTTKSSGILKYTVTQWRWSDKSPRRSLLAEYLVPLSPAVSLQSMHAATQGQDRSCTLECGNPVYQEVRSKLFCSSSNYVRLFSRHVRSGQTRHVLFSYLILTIIRIMLLLALFRITIILIVFALIRAVRFHRIVFVIIIFSSNYKRRIILLMNRSTNIF